jgi:mono/diheme cytochrome c family protein
MGMAQKIIKGILKGLGMLLGGLVGLAIIGYTSAYFISESKVNQTYEAPGVALTAPNDAATVARGQHLVSAVTACGDCHGDNLAGKVIIDDPLIGKIVAPNLTPGQNSILAQRADGEIARVLRYAVKPNGRSVIIMASEDYHDLSEPDMTAIIAYLRSLAPVDGLAGHIELRPLGRVLMALGQLPIITAESPRLKAAPISAPQPGRTIEYGRYMAQASGCFGCHGWTLSGGPIPGDPSGMLPANITPAGEVGQFTEETFISTMRTGVNPFGRKLSEQMPTRFYKNMTDEELKALWAYIRQVEPKEYGNR